MSMGLCLGAVRPVRRPINIRTAALLLAGLGFCAAQHAAAQSVVINEFTNGTPDTVELVVIANNLNMQGMILKDYSSNGANDSGGGFTFTAHALWSSVPAGTIIALREDNSALDVTVGAGDYNLDVGLMNATYFTTESGTFDIATSEIIQIKSSGSGKAGATGAIHSLASGSAGTATQFTGSPTPKLRTISGDTAVGEAAVALNPTQSLADFDGTNAVGNITSSTIGTWNNADNQAYILSLRAGGPPSNQPPSIAVSDASVQVGNDLLFLVSATNVDAGDTVTVWATNLPPGAVFPTTNALGSVSNLFAWIGASPTGTYSTTFYAEDKDGTNSDTIAISVTPPSIAADLIISEYGHSSGNNKYIELYNGLSYSVNLADYALRRQVNGTNAGPFGASLTLSGTLLPNRNYVIVHSGANNPTLSSKANLLSNADAINFSGNDPVQLLKLGTPLDIVGPLDDFSNWGANKILVRRSYVTAPSTTYIPDDWEQRSQTDWSNVGLHSMDGQPPQTGYAPTFVPGTPQIVATGSTLQFDVSATDAQDGDAIVLSATSLPAGAVFPTVTNTATVTGTLTWSNAAPVGVYTSQFAAVDIHGTNTMAVQITVTPVFPSNQTIVVHFNEVRSNDAGGDDAEFIELVAHAGTNLIGCVLKHFTGTAGSDGGVWSLTFPDFVVPDDGVVDTNGHPVGFVLLAQPDGTLAGGADILLPSIGVTAPRPSLQNDIQALVLYDPQGNVLDAVAWGDFGTPAATGDILIDDPGSSVLTQTGTPETPAFLHQIPYSSDDNDAQAPDNVIGAPSLSWTVLNATPGAINNGQTSGAIILEPQVAGPVPPPTGLHLIVW